MAGPERPGAESLLSEAMEVHRIGSGPLSAVAVRTARSLAEARTALAAKGLQRHRDAFSALAIMARADLDRGDAIRAGTSLRRAVEIAAEQFVPEDPEAVELRALLSRLES